MQRQLEVDFIACRSSSGCMV